MNNLTARSQVVHKQLMQLIFMQGKRGQDGRGGKPGPRGKKVTVFSFQCKIPMKLIVIVFLGYSHLGTDVISSLCLVYRAVLDRGAMLASWVHW